MKLNKRFLSIIIFVSFAVSLPVTANQDSLNAALNAANNELLKIKNQQATDSLKIAALENELQRIAASDTFQKEILTIQLTGLKQDKARTFEKIDSLRSLVTGYPVIGFFHDTLFNIYARSGSFSAQARAEAISNRIKQLGEMWIIDTDSISLAPAETDTDIVSGETILINISENDALWYHTTPHVLAKSYQTIITQTLNKYKTETRFSQLAKEAGLAIAVSFIIIALLFYIGKLFKWSATKITQLENNLLHGVKIKNYTLLDTKRQVNIVLSINTFVKWLAIIVTIYISLPILFGIFPWTKNYASILFGYILTPIKTIGSGLWNYLPNLITILVIVVVFRYASKIIRYLKNEIEKGHLRIPGFYPDWANPTYQIIRVLLFAFLLVVIFPYLPGSNSPVFQGVSVFLGFLFTFGSAGSLSNIIAGLILTYMRLFKLGDRVKIGDVVGDVIEKSLLVTRIRTIKNEIISIPNSTIMSSHTINYSSDAPEKGLIIHTTVTIGYDVPWKDMHQALIDAALKTTYLLNEPKPFVLQTSLEDFYVSYQINAYTREPNKQASIYSELHQNIQDVCNERGIEIMSPHYKAARDGNTTTIPANYLPKDYQAPSFNVSVNKDSNENK